MYFTALLTPLPSHQPMYRLTPGHAAVSRRGRFSALYCSLATRYGAGVWRQFRGSNFGSEHSAVADSARSGVRSRLLHGSASGQKLSCNVPGSCMKRMCCVSSRKVNSVRHVYCRNTSAIVTDIGDLLLLGTAWNTEVHPHRFTSLFALCTPRVEGQLWATAMRWRVQLPQVPLCVQ